MANPTPPALPYSAGEMRARVNILDRFRRFRATQGEKGFHPAIIGTWIEHLRTELGIIPTSLRQYLRLLIAAIQRLPHSKQRTWKDFEWRQIMDIRRSLFREAATYIPMTAATPFTAEQLWDYITHARHPLLARAALLMGTVAVRFVDLTRGENFLCLDGEAQAVNIWRCPKGQNKMIPGCIPVDECTRPFLFPLPLPGEPVTGSLTLQELNNDIKRVATLLSWDGRGLWTSYSIRHGSLQRARTAHSDEEVRLQSAHIRQIPTTYFGIANPNAKAQIAVAKAALGRANPPAPTDPITHTRRTANNPRATRTTPGALHPASSPAELQIPDLSPESKGDYFFDTQESAQLAGANQRMPPITTLLQSTMYGTPSSSGTQATEVMRQAFLWSQPTEGLEMD